MVPQHPRESPETTRHAEPFAKRENHVTARFQHALHISKGISVGAEITDDTEQKNDVELLFQDLGIDIQNLEGEPRIAGILFSAVLDHGGRVVDTRCFPERVARKNFVEVAPGAAADFQNRRGLARESAGG